MKFSILKEVQSTQIESPIARGNRAFRAGDYDEAIKWYLTAQQTAPELSKIVDVNLTIARRNYRAVHNDDNQCLNVNDSSSVKQIETEAYDQENSALIWLRKPVELTGKDVCLFVVYEKNQKDISNHKKYYLSKLKEQGFHIILIFVLDDIEAKSELLELNVDYICIRKNSGFDFGAWADVMKSVPTIWSTHLLLLANDSVYGPSDSFDKVINTIKISESDVIGLTDSYEHNHHIQTYFLAFKTRALKNRSFKEFWMEVENKTLKQDVIHEYEIEFTSFCRKIGLKVCAIFLTDESLTKSNKAHNPVHENWSSLIERGFPFIKVELLKQNPKNIDLSMLNVLANRFFSIESIPVSVLIENSVIEAEELTQNECTNNQYEFEIKLINESGFFNECFYLDTYPDVGTKGLAHFCEYGWREGRNPTEYFNTNYYLEKYPDVSDNGINPFLHWIQYGKSEQRIINVIEIDPEENNFINKPSLIFISHEASQTGAPSVLLSLMEWIKNNTDINFSIIVGAQGPWNKRFEEIAPCFYLDAYPQSQLKKEIHSFCGNHVQVVYVNTIASGHYAEHLNFLNAEFITHVHEMENVFKIFESNFEALKKLCSKFIAVSQGSIDAIKKRTNGQNIELFFLKPFIDKRQENLSIQPINLEIGTNKKIIFGCGAVETRKGFDLFCQVGVELLRQGVKDFKMYWIGSAENKDLNPQAEIKSNNLLDYVEYLGVKQCPRDYFISGDIFLLPSREDPYPLVCLEAAECEMPIICFDEQAGGMHSFVESDAGVVVPYLDIKAMALATKELLNNHQQRRRLGKRAHLKVKERHYVDVIAPKILDLLPSLNNSNAQTELGSYKELIDDSEIISFDIFDTLITRRLSDPSVVFDVVEYRFTKNETAAVSLIKERMDTAGKILNSYKGTRDDISIDEIYNSMPFYRNATIEKDTEVQMCVPHPLGLKLYQYARQKNKRIYIASDMYLDQGTIESILVKCGITHWDELFLSSTIGKKKDTGKLFPHLLTKAKHLGMEPIDILHIGDNWVGDIYKAKKAGIKAIRFSPIYEANHKLFPLDEEIKAGLSQIGRIWNAFCTQATKLWHENNCSLAKDFYIKLGFELTGPFATMMALYAKELSDNLGVKKIIFMARDGRIIKKAFDSLFEDKLVSGHYDSCYLHLSRATIIPATFDNPLSSNDIYFLIEGLHLAQKPLSYFLEKAGLDLSNKFVCSVVERYFESYSLVPDWDDLELLSKMFFELSAHIYDCNKQKRDALKRYLEQNKVLEQDKVLIVDVGWLLNIQSRLDKFIKSLGKEVQVIGCYVGSRERINKSLTHSSLLFSNGEPCHYAQFFEKNTTLFELLFSAPEPSASSLTIGDKSGKAQVLFKKLPSPLSTEFMVAQKIQMGAEAFFKMFIDARNDFFPEQISKDYFYHLFKTLVETDNDLAKASLGQFELMLGGHHEFIAHENLVNSNSQFEFKLKKIEEYFNPLVFNVQNPVQKHVIITSAGTSNGSTRYRAIHLAESLTELHISSTLIHSATDIKDAQYLINEADIIIFQRCFEEQGNVGDFFNIAQSTGKRCWYEIDDLIFPEHIPVIGSVVGGEWSLDEAMFVATSYETLMKKCDGCIASTPEIKQYIENNYNLQTILVRNKVPQNYLIPPTSKQHRQLKLIYASGTYSHKQDFEMIESVVYELLCQYTHVHLSILGAAQVSERILALPNVSNYPLLEYSAMLKFISEHDVMLMPLVDNIFNRAKSSVKFVEASAVGVATIASKIGEFNLVIQHEKNGILVNSANAWFDVLKTIIQFPKTIDVIKCSAFETINSDYVLSKMEHDAAVFFRNAV